MADFKDRLSELFKSLKLSQVKASEKTGVGRSSLSEYLAGKKEPTISVATKIAIATGVDLNWLLIGEGEMFKEPNKNKSVPVGDIPRELMKDWIDSFWEHADPDERVWLKVEMKKRFPEFADYIKKRKESDCQDQDKGYRLGNVA